MTAGPRLTIVPVTFDVACAYVGLRTLWEAS